MTPPVRPEPASPPPDEPAWPTGTTWPSNPPTEDLWQLVVGPGLTEALLLWLKGQGLDWYPIPIPEGEDLPTYAVSWRKR